jgi:hypothetical protein
LAALSGLQAGLAAITRQQDAARRSTQYALGQWGPNEAQRTLDEYIEQVEAWRADWVGVATKSLAGRYFEDGYGVIQLEVRNLGSRFLPDVEVEAHFEFEQAKGLDEPPACSATARTRRGYGVPEPPQNPLLGMLDRGYEIPYATDCQIPAHVRRGRLNRGAVPNGRSETARQRHRDEVFVVLSARPEDGTLHGTWKATVRDIDGVLTGVVDVPVAEEPVDIAELLSPSEA